jgi:flagellar basal-body rod protein FlgB
MARESLAESLLRGVYAIFAKRGDITPMDPTRSGPIALAEQRMHWLDRRQQVLSRNMANADTPGFRASDLVPFHQMLARRGSAPMRVTDPRHLHPVGGAGALVRRDRVAAEQSPNGNAVSVEEQAMKIADTDSAHALATNLHRRLTGLFRTALGRGA